MTTETVTVIVAADQDTLELRPTTEAIEVIASPAETLEIIATGSVGPQGPPGPAGGASFIHYQDIPVEVWTIIHNLARYPSVTVVDSANRVIFGDVQYVDANQVAVTFSSAFGGKAFIN